MWIQKYQNYSKNINHEKGDFMEVINKKVI